MMRRLITCLVLVGAVACGGDKASTELAGKVVSVEGTATAKRGDAEARALAVGDDVFADDTIETTKGSEVVVRLEKNGVPLALSDGASALVSTSAAWRAPKSREGSGMATDLSDPSVSAGRSGDRESGSHSSSAVANTTGRDLKQVAKQDRKSDSDDRKEPGGSDKATKERNKGTGETVASSVTSTKNGEGGTGKIDDIIQGHSDDVGRGENPKDEAKVSKVQPSKRGTLRLRKVAPSEHRATLQRILRRHQHFVGVCLVERNGKLAFSGSFKVSADGAVTALELVHKDLSKKEEACVRRTLSHKLPAELAGVTATFVAAYR